MKTDQTIKMARVLLARPDFLYIASSEMAKHDVVGEDINRLVLFLAMITRNLDDPVSVIVKGPTSSGKSNLVKAVLRLMPPGIVEVRSSLSPKAIVNTKVDLNGKVLYIQEYRGGKDARLLTRLLQSEREVIHERSVTVGGRGTAISRKQGKVVVVTTTTDDQIFADDETRFLSLRVDESPEQTTAVVKAVFGNRIAKKESKPLRVWQQVVATIAAEIPIVKVPDWLVAVAELIPSPEPRVRRDSGRFLSLLKAIAVCQSYSDGRRKRTTSIEINFADYCVAYRLLQIAFTSTLAGRHPNEVRVAQAVRALKRRQGRSVTADEVAKTLEWELSAAYKWLKQAQQHELVRYEPTTAQCNRKLILPGEKWPRTFLPHPKRILREIESLPASVAYVDPLTGEETEVTGGPKNRRGGRQ